MNIQLHLQKIDPENVNMQMLEAQPEGTVAVILDLEGKLKGIDQKGNEVAIIVSPETPEAPTMTEETQEAIIGQVSDKLNEGLNSALEAQKKEIEDAHRKAIEEVSEAFTSQLKQVQDELKKLSPKVK